MFIVLVLVIPYFYNLYFFFFFCRREPEDIKSIDADRDVFNERPSKEDIISSTEAACKFYSKL